jgi:predicted RNA-binding protein with PUA-like domain
MAGHWLLKSDPETFSIDDLARAKNKTTSWDGVRNYQARNFLRDGVKLGDRVLFYHSSSEEETGIVGTAVIVREAHPEKDPTWVMVDVKLVSKFRGCITREKLAAHPQLKKMDVLRRGNRLSVMPVTAAQFDAVLKLAAARPVGS